MVFQAAIARIKPVIAQSAALRHATIAAKKATLAVNVTPRRKRSHATAVAKPAIFRAIALTLVLVAEELPAVLADTLVAEAARNATNVARSDISLVIAPRVPTVQEEDTAVRAKAVTVVAAMEAELVKEDRLATRAEGMATCLATVLKAKNATTVRARLPLFDTNANSSRWRSWSPEPRLPVRAHVRACLLQVQAAWPRAGSLP